MNLEETKQVKELWKGYKELKYHASQESAKAITNTCD